MNETTITDSSEIPYSPHKTGVFLQDACHQHRFIRSPNLSAIVERPERLRALKIGLSAAIARLEDIYGSPPTNASIKADDDELSSALSKLGLQDMKTDVIHLIKSAKTIDLLKNEAVKFVHGDISRDVYLENLVLWASESRKKIENGESEIPSNLSQGDLYLCPGSLEAIQGALATVCEAVDSVIDTSRRIGPSSNEVSTTNAFVAIRPPGHHCGEDTPSGFCFVNNVAVSAAHAHLKHGIKKVVIFDIDLHHGNGTQSIVWQINEEYYREKLESEAGSLNAKPGLQVYYGSIHDVLSYPCEDGNAAMIQAASTSIHGAHGQHIENIHLQPYKSDEEFMTDLYPNVYCKIFDEARSFVAENTANDVLVMISCGFDACEHEYPSMSRHNRRVPTSFYYRFAKDAQNFADKHARGKLISVLEGGYSDRALISGGMAHLSGLVDGRGFKGAVSEDWWAVDNLIALEKATKKRRGGKVSLGTRDSWLERTLSIFSSIDTTITPSPTSHALSLPPSTRVLRQRNPPTSASSGTVTGSKTSPSKQPQAKPRSKGTAPTIPPAAVDEVVENFLALKLDTVEPVVPAKSQTEEPSLQVEPSQDGPRKLPKVILRLKEPEPGQD